MLKPEKLKSCVADRDEGGRRDVFSAQIVYRVYIRFSSGDIRDEGGEVSIGVSDRCALTCKKLATKWYNLVSGWNSKWCTLHKERQLGPRVQLWDSKPNK